MKTVDNISHFYVLDHHKFFHLWVMLGKQTYDDLVHKMGYTVDPA